jgi:hypothetical protein
VLQTFDVHTRNESLKNLWPTGVLGSQREAPNFSKIKRRCKKETPKGDEGNWI